MPFDEEMGWSEYEQAKFDAWIDYLADLKEQEKTRGLIKIPNPERMNVLKETVAKLTKIAQEHNLKVKIDYGIEDLTYGGYITLNCPYGFGTPDVIGFCEAIKDVDCVEFTIENNNIQVGISVEEVLNISYLDE